MAYYAIFYGDEMSKVAIIVETRKHMALSFVLNNVMSILPDEWKLQIFHGLNNLDYIKDIMFDDDFLSEVKKKTTFTNLNIESITADDSSLDIMLTEKFWNEIIGEDVLYFECDAMLCPNSEYKIEDFEHFDYIGGYWGDSFHERSVDEVYERVMNGGVSFRKKSYMLDIIKNQLKPYLERGGNPCEDYFVSELLNNKPTVREVLNFSIDCGYMYPLNSKAPFGVHKPWGTPPKRGHGKHYNAIKMVCPEVEELENLQEVIDV